MSEQADQADGADGLAGLRLGLPPADRKLFLQMVAVLTSAGSFVVKNAVICKEGCLMRHLFFSEGHLWAC